jgi:hypothetical protein
VTEIALISSLLKVASSLFGLFKGASALDKAKAEGLAVLLEKVADCLVATTVAIRGGQVPHGECGRLQTYAMELPQALDGFMAAEKATDLGDLLLSAYRVEGLAYDLAQTSDREAHLAQLEEASGKFRATADLIRAGIL